MLQLVTIHGGIPTTTSEVFAAHTDNDHASVLKLIREHLQDFEEFGRVGFEIQPFMTAGGQQTRTVAILNEDQAILLLTYLRNSEVVREFKKRLVKAFRALVNQVTGPVQVLLSMSRTDMLRMALGLSEERDVLKAQTTQQQATIAVLEPKAQALDRLSDATGNHCVTDAAKVLRMRPSDLFDWLSQHGWIYRRPNGGAWIAYQDRIDGGFLVNKVLTLPGKVVVVDGRRESLPDKVKDRLMVTPKGLAHLSQIMNKAAS